MRTKSYLFDLHFRLVLSIIVFLSNKFVRVPFIAISTTEINEDVHYLELEMHTYQTQKNTPLILMLRNVGYIAHNQNILFKMCYRC